MAISAESRRSVARGSARVLENQVCAALADHDCRRIRVRRRNGRHDRSIDDAQARYAMDAQSRIDDRFAGSSHPARADRVPRGLSGLASIFEQRIVWHLVTGPRLLDNVGTKRRLRRDPAYQPQQAYDRLAIERILEIVRVDAWMLARIAGADMDVSARLRLQHESTDRESREGVDSRAGRARKAVASADVVNAHHDVRLVALVARPRDRMRGRRRSRKESPTS